MGHDQDRRDLHAALEHSIGPRPATILMNLLPPVGYADLARRSDVDGLGMALRGEMADLGAALRGEMADLGAALRGEMADLRVETADLRTEMRSGFGDIRIEMQRQFVRFVYTNLALMIAVAGLVLAAVTIGRS
ncbi:MAG: hypothetical protein AB1673_01415 [Actinomycetota bacterium]